MKNFLLLFIVFVLCGCTTMAERARDDLKVGMTKAQVMDVLGIPDYMSNAKTVDFWCYNGRPDVNIWFDKNDRMAKWTTGGLGGGGSAPCGNTQIGEINTNLQNINNTMQQNEVMRRNGL